MSELEQRELEGSKPVKPMRAFKTREQELEDTLRELLTKHFYNTSFYWGHTESHNLQGLNVKLYAKIVTLLPGILEEME